MKRRLQKNQKKKKQRERYFRLLATEKEGLRRSSKTLVSKGFRTLGAHGKRWRNPKKMDGIRSTLKKVKGDSAEKTLRTNQDHQK